jgi:hypothetical protein
MVWQVVIISMARDKRVGWMFLVQESHLVEALNTEYLTTFNTYKTRTSMPPVGFKLALRAS